MEFIESLGRVAEKISLHPLKLEDQEWSYEKKRNLELHFKIESLLSLLYEYCSNRAFKETFKIPSHSFFLEHLQITTSSKKQKQKIK
jgi:hypothetical protein